MISLTDNDIIKNEGNNDQKEVKRRDGEGEEKRRREEKLSMRIEEGEVARKSSREECAHPKNVLQ